MKPIARSCYELRQPVLQIIVPPYLPREILQD